jgi:hypothetical protein
MKAIKKEYIVNQDESVTFLEDYSYAHGGEAKKGETLSPIEIKTRNIMFCYKPLGLSWGYNCELPVGDLLVN